MGGVAWLGLGVPACPMVQAMVQCPATPQNAAPTQLAKKTHARSPAFSTRVKVNNAGRKGGKGTHVQVHEEQRDRLQVMQSSSSCCLGDECKKHREQPNHHALHEVLVPISAPGKGIKKKTLGARRTIEGTRVLKDATGSGHPTSISCWSLVDCLACT